MHDALGTYYSTTRQTNFDYGTGHMFFSFGKHNLFLFLGPWNKSFPFFLKEKNQKYLLSFSIKWELMPPDESIKVYMASLIPTFHALMHSNEHKRREREIITMIPMARRRRIEDGRHGERAIFIAPCSSFVRLELRHIKSTGHTAQCIYLYQKFNWWILIKQEILIK